MSLILDALRKSEAERRKAHAAADALADVPRTPAASFIPVPAWVWPTAAVAALALALWWWMGRSAPPEASATSDATASIDDAAGAVSGGTPTDVRSPDTELDPTRPNTANRTDASTSDAVVTAASESSTVVPTVAAAVMAPPGGPASIAAPGTAPSLAAESTPNATAMRAATPVSANSMPMPSAPAAATPAPTHPAPSTTDLPALPREPVASAPRADTATGTPLRLADLSTADRQQLPPLKMSMHMWGADSARRFAIIDGKRVAEGDRVGEAVVETINQDDVVLAWNGIRVRVPVR